MNGTHTADYISCAELEHVFIYGHVLNSDIFVRSHYRIDLLVILLRHCMSISMEVERNFISVLTVTQTSKAVTKVQIVNAEDTGESCKTHFEIESTHLHRSRFAAQLSSRSTLNIYWGYCEHSYLRRTCSLKSRTKTCRTEK